MKNCQLKLYVNFSYLNVSNLLKIKFKIYREKLKETIRVDFSYILVDNFKIMRKEKRRSR